MYTSYIYLPPSLHSQWHKVRDTIRKTFVLSWIRNVKVFLSPSGDEMSTPSTLRFRNTWRGSNISVYWLSPKVWSRVTEVSDTQGLIRVKASSFRSPSFHLYFRGPGLCLGSPSEWNDHFLPTTDCPPKRHGYLTTNKKDKKVVHPTLGTLQGITVGLTFGTHFRPWYPTFPSQSTSLGIPRVYVNKLEFTIRTN